MKNKTTAGILAILVGGLGIHKFYLDRPIWGVLYLVFCWTLVPAILSFFEGLVYLVDSEDDFNKRYNPGYVAQVPDSVAKMLAEIQTNKTIVFQCNTRSWPKLYDKWNALKR